MKRIATPLGVAIALTTATMAYAADASGAIKSMDATAHSITLDNGQVYVFNTKTDLSKLKVGEKVQITFKAENGKNMASAVTAI